MLKKLLFGFVLAFIFVPDDLRASVASACCVERGYYDLVVEKPDEYYVGLLGEIRFGPTAELYMTQAGYDGIRGIDGLEAAIESDSEVTFNIAETFQKRQWRLEFTAGAGKKGSLTLPLPAQMRRLKVDTREGDDGKPVPNITVYKEFSFTGSVGGGNGIFRKANTKPVSYSLILQGTGNRCDSASDFRHWRLEVNSRSSRYAFLGTLKSDEGGE